MLILCVCGFRYFVFVDLDVAPVDVDLDVALGDVTYWYILCCGFKFQCFVMWI